MVHESKKNINKTKLRAQKNQVESAVSVAKQDTTQGHVKNDWF